MNTLAGALPISMINEKFSGQHIFNNFYRFEMTSGDSEMKGVLILESDESSKLILEGTNSLGDNTIRIHTLLSLSKNNDSESTITNFVNTSWTSQSSGGFFVSGDNVLRYSNNTAYNTELILDKFDVSFGDRDQNVVSFDADISLHSALDSSNVINLPFNEKVSIYRAGKNIWYGIAEEGHQSQFVLSITPNETGTTPYIILTANLNIERNGKYYYVSDGSLMIRK